MYALQIAESSTGQIAEWTLHLEPLKHLTQDQLDALINRIDTYVFDQIEQATKENN
jgi:hypothetical protein